jgi:methionyl aminopeptidase
MADVARILRSRREIGLMRRAGLLVWQAHQEAARLIRPGVTTGQLEDAIAGVFRQARAEPLFLNYPGQTPFPAVSCISVNEELVHGIPGSRELQDGDIVSIDTGCRIGGWCGDAAVTHPVGAVNARARKILEVTHGALNLAIELMARKTWWSEIAREMQEYVEGQRCAVITTMVGHAIGQEMHESPQVPNFYDPEWVEKEDFDLRPGVVLAVEPMVSLGSAELRHLSDHWTCITRDRSLCAHFEHTIAMTADGPRRLTAAPESDQEKSGLPDWLQDESVWVSW